MSIIMIHVNAESLTLNAKCDFAVNLAKLSEKYAKRTLFFSKKAGKMLNACASGVRQKAFIVQLYSPMKVQDSHSIVHAYIYPNDF
ncbi:MAG: hypothetical protein QM610_07985 [Chitinophagaceae bacterium]